MIAGGFVRLLPERLDGRVGRLSDYIPLRRQRIEYIMINRQLTILPYCAIFHIDRLVSLY